MKIKYHMSKPFRIKRFKFIQLEPLNSNNCWWAPKKKKWVSDTRERSFSCVNVNSLKAAKRHVRKYGEPGVTYILLSRFRGYDIEITKDRNNEI